MKKKILFLILICFCALMFSACSTQTNPYDNSNISYEHEYAIKSLDVNIKVNKDRTARVTENYTVLFKVRSLGISRYLPYANGELYRDIDVKGDVYFITDEGKYFSINTGAKNYSGKVYSAGSTVNYQISYTIVPPKKTAKNTNYYMNVVGHGWSTSQSNITVNMEFPYTIKSAKVYYGGYGETNTISPTINGKSLSLSIAKLAPYQGITVNAQFGKMFGFYLDGRAIIIILTLGIVLAGVVLLKKIKYKNDILTPVVNFYPPKKDGRNLTPAEAGFLIDSMSDSGDVTSLIFYFASKGYLKIKDANGNMKLLKLVKELPSSEPEHASIAFNGLFKSGAEVSVSQLSEKYYTTLERVKISVKKDYAGKLYKNTQKSAGIAIFAAILVALGSLLMMFALDFMYILPVAFVGAISPIITYAITLFTARHKHKFSKKSYVFGLILALIIGSVISLIISAISLKGIVHFIPKFIIFELATMIGFFAGFCTVRTKFYNEELNQLLGFREFLLAAEKDRLETLLQENPEYYYDILPYANVLGVSDIWMKKFEGLTIEPPRYYESSSMYFDLVMFNMFYRTSFASLRAAAVSMPKNKMSGGGFGGGGFSGGGFSGGGFGGGGGGRR